MNASRSGNTNISAADALVALGPVPCVCSMTAYQFPLVDMYAKWHSRALAAEKQKANIIAEEINM
ncbi:hypothetical protein QRX41_07260 [Bifidobacterium sp. H1HS16N]|uniref:Uncharacterized protein n=1 Tax=Bifidobacterium kimbladii TaxID=1293826 RepID=A0ABU3KGM8_9BIFI|nr:hypothetical protein [Bifidobacterium sp. H1HS16N]MDT7509920.1 hypothetical protein [Bifidobacterium sp. H1HS16N]